VAIPEDLLEILRCVECAGVVAEQPERLVCETCGRRYPIIDGVPVMLRDSAMGPVER
jgi:uncharacterized protein YbaR (Trm112 family)